MSTTGISPKNKIYWRVLHRWVQYFYLQYYNFCYPHDENLLVTTIEKTYNSYFIFFWFARSEDTYY